MDVFIKQERTSVTKTDRKIYYNGISFGLKLSLCLPFSLPLRETSDEKVLMSISKCTNWSLPLRREMNELMGKTRQPGAKEKLK